MGKFFNGKVKTNRSTMIKIGIITGSILLIIICLILISVSKNKKENSAPNIEIKNEISIEINGDQPKTLDYFKVFENYDENQVKVVYPDDFDISKLGLYKISIIVDDNTYYVNGNVIDTTPPRFVAKDYEIKAGETYSEADFLSECEDNSGIDAGCYIEYYVPTDSDEGEIVDYSSYTEIGTYEIKVIASDDSKNNTEPQTVKLIINDGEDTPEPTSCDYGNTKVNNLDYDYPMAVTVADTDNDCALNRDLWDNVETQKPAQAFYEKDFERLKTQTKTILETNFPNGAKSVVYPHYIAILNETTTGLVGYAIYVKVYMAASDSTSKIDTVENLKFAYYLNADGTRKYVTNIYNLGI